MNLPLNKMLDVFAGIFNQKNLDAFNKAMSDFGKSMDSITKELGEDTVRHNKNQEDREAINKKNLDKIWGKRS